MDQKQFDAQLVEIEAQYIANKTDIEEDIRNLRVEMEQECALHDQRIHDIKMKITVKEIVLAGFKKEFIRQKADLHAEFSKSESWDLLSMCQKMNAEHSAWIAHLETKSSLVVSFSGRNFVDR